MKRLFLEACLYARVLWAAVTRGSNDITPVGRLSVRVIRSNGVQDLGLVSTKVVTDAGVQYIVDSLQGLVEPENLKFHGSGTGTTAESSSQTELVAEVSSRGVGSLGEGSSANIFKSVGVVSYGAALNITEHGLFSASTGGTLFDRSVFTAIPVDSGDSIEFTYELTLPSGS
jgi:hypothetical protein